MTDKYCRRNEIKKLEGVVEFESKRYRCDRVQPTFPGTSTAVVVASKPKTMQGILKCNDLMAKKKKISTFAERQAENKRKLDNNNQA
ncbi:hypothetical protein Tco_0562684 [Tanacetum coccineum]|uniref:Uncharacterized protein n=1 Tax=Tanacetum coccineum TaxID=301880 RepID=A0ABQ4XFV2_9ASTR